MSLIASAATITPIPGPGGFLSPITYTDDFEVGADKSSPPNTPPFTFESTAKLGLASAWTAGVTSSGVKGLVESYDSNPLEIVFASPVNEVGMYFGNDDFGRVFNANLELFDANNASLGKVQVRSNGNDQADQFIGARSSLPARSALIYYDQPNAQLLSVYIDDLRVGALVPEPSSLALVTCGLMGVFGLCHRRPGNR